LLLAASWGKSRSQLLASIGDTVPAEVAARFEQARQQRANGVPVAYLLGRREFWSLDFAVNPAVLVPRPETELLVQRILDLVPSPMAAVADLGTGSGAIAIALAHERPRWRVTGTDASATALEVARANGERLVGGRVEWAQGDWYGALGDRRFDVLVSNPPYIAGDDPCCPATALRTSPAVRSPRKVMDMPPWPLLLMGPPATSSRAAGWRSNTETLKGRGCVRCLSPVASLT
jgi:release factor glutamine methyltransferase